MTAHVEHYKRGLACFGQGKHEEAITAFRAALEAKPGWLDALHALATALSKSGDHDGALAMIERVIQLDPEDPFAYTSQSIFFQRKGLVPEAEKAQAKARMASWKQELKKNPNAPPPDTGPMKVVQ
ncbi:MAG: tetratricopeptide repeat protein [Planctomycetes bacterium]|nr:tetratricopeptide repeat protein [Planctomycetota bacterium]